jgi:hypothetical protein
MHGASSSSQASSRRSLETELELAVRSGDLNLQSKQFTDFPSLLLKRYVLADTRDVNLSKNKLQEIPVECSQFPNLEKLIMYNNIIRYVVFSHANSSVADLNPDPQVRGMDPAPDPSIIMLKK